MSFDLDVAVRRGEAEIAWCERTAKKIEAGDPYMPGLNQV